MTGRRREDTLVSSKARIDAGFLLRELQIGKTMKSEIRNKLKKTGWKVGTVTEFLGLTPDEAAYIELKLNLSHHLKEQRRARGLTQAMIATMIGSSQSRIAKAETNDPTVSIDLLVRALFASGLTQAGLADLIASHPNSIEPASV